MSERVVSRGKIRVDARRAVAKLREHLLVDLHLYALEIVRAAVACGAPTIDVTHDADDVRFSFGGLPIAPERLPALLDHVLTEDEVDARRLLAIGVNAALGLSPQFVDVYLRPSEGDAIRVRFTPEMLAREEEPSIGAAQIELARGSMQIHVRRRLGWEVLRRATLGGSLQELSALAAATHDLPIELTLQGKPWARRRPSVLLRIPLDMAELDVTLAELQIVAAEAATPRIEICERGVRLVSLSFAPTGFAVEPHEKTVFPARVVVDAPSLPTNASRSAIREDSLLLHRVVEQADQAMLRALAALRAIILEEGEVPEGVQVEVSGQALEEALGAMVCLAVGARQRGATLGAPSHELLRAPLLRHACDVPMSYLDLIGGLDRPVYAHRGTEPLDRALAPFLSRVVWIRQRVAERPLEGLVLRDAAPLVAEARQSLAHREAFRAHPKGPVSIPASPGQLVRESFSVEEGTYRGLEGQVALRLPTEGRGGSTVRIFVEGREIGTRSLAPSVVPLCLDIAIAWEGRFVPTPHYDDVEDDADLTVAMWYASQVAVLEAEELAPRLELASLADEEREWLAAVLRSAVGTALRSGRALGLGEEFKSDLPAGGALFSAAIWPTSSGDRVSLASLRRELAKRGALLTASPTTRGRAVHARPVLALPPAELGWLAEALESPVFVAYDRALGVGDRLPALEEALRHELEVQKLRGAVTMEFRRPGARGLIAVGREPRLVELHAGHRLSSAPHADSICNAIVVVDDDTLTPHTDWSRSLSRDREWSLAGVERELLQVEVAAFGGDEAASARLRGNSSQAVLRAHLITGATALREAAHPADADLFDRLMELSLVPCLDESGKTVDVSLARLEALYPAPKRVPVLQAPPGFETLDWWPLVLTSKTLRRALEGFTDLVKGEPELEERRAAAEVARARARVLEKPEVAQWELGDLAPSDAPTGRHKDGLDSAVVALPPRAVDPPRAVADVTFRRHPVGRFILEECPPVVARIVLSDEQFFERMAELSGAGLERTKELLGGAAATLGQAVLEQGTLGEPRATHLFHWMAAGPHAHRLGPPLRLAPIARAQGGTTRLADLRGGEPVLYSTKRFEPWLEGTPGALDEPVLHLAQDVGGALLRLLLERLGFTLRDVTEPMAALQARRGGERAEAPAHLSGVPLHPSLRRSFPRLLVRGVEGELELALSGSSSVTIIDLDAPPRILEVDLPCAVRAVVRTGALQSARNDERIRRQLRSALRELFRLLGAELGSLPPEVRAAYRATVIDCLERGARSRKHERSAPLFADLEGAFHSLDDLGDTVTATVLPPPYPSLERRPILRLTERERDALARSIDVTDVSDLIARHHEAERRRNGPRVEAEVGAIATLARSRMSWDDLAGEVALLSPAEATARGITVLADGRPLCRLDDGKGAPLIAAVETKAAPNPFFDDLADGEARDSIVARVREMGVSLARSLVRTPPGALATSFVDEQVGAAHFVGALWLVSPMAKTSVVEVLTAGGMAQVMPQRAQAIVAFDGTMPLAGKLVLFAEAGVAAREALDQLLLDRFGVLVQGLDEGAEAAKYRWNAALLSAPGHPFLTAPTADGGSVDIQELQHEIDTRGSVWVSSGRGLADGRFPDEPPAFVLADAPASPLLAVLRLRDLGGLVRELGGLDLGADGPSEMVSDPEGPIAVPELSGHAPSPFASSEARVADEKQRGVETVEIGGTGGDRAPSVEVVEPWLRGLVRRVMSAFRELPEPPPPTGVALRDSMLAQLRGLNLQGDPVEDVVFAREGRPIRYDARRRRVIVHRNHDDVVALVSLERDEPSPSALDALVAAAVSEINRADRAVTAAEERRALLALLNAAAAEHGSTP